MLNFRINLNKFSINSDASLTIIIKDPKWYMLYCILSLQLYHTYMIYYILQLIYIHVDIWIWYHLSLWHANHCKLDYTSVAVWRIHHAIISVVKPQLSNIIMGGRRCQTCQLCWDQASVDSWTARINLFMYIVYAIHMHVHSFCSFLSFPFVESLTINYDPL